VTDVSWPALLALGAGAGFVVGFLRASVGGGVGLVLTPALSLLLPVPFVLGLGSALLSLSDPITLALFWRQWDRRLVRLILPTMLAGIVLGGWAISGLDEAGLRRTIGGVALLFAVLQLGAILGGSGPARAQRHWAVAAGVGLAAGTASSIAHSGGVILTPYLAGLGLANATVIATGSVAVAVSNVLKLATYWVIGFLTWPVAAVALAATPFLYAGSWLGHRLNRWIPRRWFALLLLGLAIVGSVRLLAT
jgi:uncharacterized membrane protein YfcA